MAVDKKQKNKKKRGEKQKARRQETEQQVRIEKADEYAWMARNAYHAGKYREALTYALKNLKVHPTDATMRSIALRCAENLDDEAVLLNVLTHFFRAGLLYMRDRYFQLGRLAISRKNYRLGREVLDILVSDVGSDTPQLLGRLTKAKLKEAQQLLLFCKNMEAKPILAGHVARQTTHTPQPSQAGRASRPPQPIQSAQPPGTSQVPQTTRSPIGSKQTPPPASQAAAPAASPSPTQSGIAGAAPIPLVAAAFPQESIPELKIVFETDPEPVLETIRSHRKTDQTALDLALRAYRLSFRTSYDQLLCLPTLRDVTSLWYQEETARKVMKTFRGRAILADEVGLGKTIEAGLIVKEYMMRGLVRSALILAPSSLVHQWQEELSGKFGISFVSTNDVLFKQDPDQFWNEPFIIASIQTAKSKRHFDAVTSRSYDILVVDEAHHLKNRTTLNWKLADSIQKTFLLMLTATPVQNSLEELYNLVTLLRPGHLKTQKAFKEQFVTRGNPTDPRNREKLRQLLKEVMVRNTRSVTQLRLPSRFATTVRINPSEAEDAFYGSVNRFVASRADGRTSKISKLALKKLLEAAGSSHAATLRMLERMSENNDNETAREVRDLVELGRSIRLSSKVRQVVELVKASKDQKIIFVNYIATLEYIQQVLQEQRVSHVVYHGGMNTAQKQAAMDDFRNGRSVLLTTGTGGEGHNLQFCHVMLNYDLPWNPMEIEQRIGRIHRIGQEREVQVYNFCAAGSIEDRILEILDRKINMFELVVGEIDMILGRLQGEEEFSDMVYEIWVKHPDETEREKAFAALAARLKRARSAYTNSKELDEKLFQEDFGI